MIKAGTFPKVILAIFVACVLGLVFNLISASTLTVNYMDNFETDTTGTYSWKFIDNEYSFYNYTPGRSVQITILESGADPIGSTKAVLKKELGYAFTGGVFSIYFRPTDIIYSSGAALIKIYSKSNPTNYYQFLIARPNPDLESGPHKGVRTQLMKSVNGTLVINSQIDPTPEEYQYNLDEWRSLYMVFNPSTLVGKLGDQQVLSGTDPDAHSIEVDTIWIQFNQQSQLLDDITVQGIPSFIYASVDIKPDSVEEIMGLQADFVRCFIEFAKEVNLYNIDIETDRGTVRLNDTLPAVGETSRQDYDHNGIDDWEVRFDRSDVQEVVEKILAAREQPKPKPKPVAVRLREFFASIISPTPFKPSEEEEKAAKLEVKKPPVAELAPVTPIPGLVFEGVRLTVTGEVSGIRFQGTDTLQE